MPRFQAEMGQDFGLSFGDLGREGLGGAVVGDTSRLGSTSDPDYIYSSWIREATVYVSRAKLDADPDNPTQTRGGFILSAARDLMVENPAMRPDPTDSQVPADDITNYDIALNPLCECAIAYCIIMAAMGTDRGSAYPSSVAFDEGRAKSMAGNRVPLAPCVTI